MASSNTPRLWQRVGIYGGVIAGGLIGVQLWLSRVRHDALLPPPVPQREKPTFPAAFLGMLKAVESAPSRHVVGRFPQTPTVRYESWHQGPLFRHDDSAGTFAFDGERYWLYSLGQKTAWVARSEDDLDLGHPNPKNTFPRSL
jgi:hypothetical protein